MDCSRAANERSFGKPGCDSWTDSQLDSSCGEGSLLRRSCSSDFSNCSVFGLHLDTLSEAQEDFMYPDENQVMDSDLCTFKYCSEGGVVGDSCSLLPEYTADSSRSEQDVLVCEESLADGSEWGMKAPTHAASPPPFAPTPPFCDGREVQEQISNELIREQEVRAELCNTVSCEDRSKAVSWLVEVATEYNLQHETLFLAVAHFDRFLSVSKIVPPGGLLQLLALACVSLAAKQEEVKQMPPVQWTNLVMDLFNKEDLNKMEFLVLETLDWRVRVPTAYSFLQLFLHALSAQGGQLPTMSDDVVFSAHFLAELSMLHSDFMQYSYSTVAVACVVLSEWNASSIAAQAAAATCGATVAPSAPNPTIATALFKLGVNDHVGVKACVSSLFALFQMACSPQASDVMAPIQARYPSTYL